MPAATATCEHPRCADCPMRAASEPVVAARFEAPASCAHRMEPPRATKRVGMAGLYGSIRITREAAALLPVKWAPADLRRLIEVGTLALYERPFIPKYSGEPKIEVEEPPEEASPAAVEEKTWIEIQLLDEICEPIAGERYKITMPDGSVQEGNLNYLGKARVENIDEPGACRITFPHLDADAWHSNVVCPAPPPPPPKLTFVEFQLVDMDEQPVKGEFYRITGPDGVAYEGFLDKSGSVRFDKIPEGEYKIAFPDLDADAWSAMNDA